MRLIALCVLGVLNPCVAGAQALLLEDFAVFRGSSPSESIAQDRAEIVACLQGTRVPQSCVGIVSKACEGEVQACEVREVVVWEHYGFDVYLALRQALGGPDWIDAAHRRIGLEMVARCDAQVLDSAEAVRAACELQEAAGRALALRFALVAP